jgi:hypothetical protein
MIAPVPDHLRTLFLGNLPYYCHEYDVLSLFQGYGKIESIRLIKKNHSKGNMGYGFITFEDYQAAMVAACKLHGQLLLGRNIRFILTFIPVCFYYYCIMCRISHANPKQLLDLQHSGEQTIFSPDLCSTLVNPMKQCVVNLPSADTHVIHFSYNSDQVKIFLSMLFLIQFWIFRFFIS